MLHARLRGRGGGSVTFYARKVATKNTDIMQHLPTTAESPHFLTRQKIQQRAPGLLRSRSNPPTAQTAPPSPGKLRTNMIRLSSLETGGMQTIENQQQQPRRDHRGPRGGKNKKTQKPERLAYKHRIQPLTLFLYVSTQSCATWRQLLCVKRAVFLRRATLLSGLHWVIPLGYASCSGADGVHKDCRIRSWNDCLFSGSTQGLCTCKKLRGRQPGRGGASVLPLLCSYWPYLI